MAESGNARLRSMSASTRIQITKHAASTATAAIMKGDVTVLWSHARPEPVTCSAASLMKSWESVLSNGMPSQKRWLAFTAALLCLIAHRQQRGEAPQHALRDDVPVLEIHGVGGEPAAQPQLVLVVGLAALVAPYALLQAIANIVEP